MYILVRHVIFSTCGLRLIIEAKNTMLAIRYKYVILKLCYVLCKVAAEFWQGLDLDACTNDVLFMPWILF